MLQAIAIAHLVPTSAEQLSTMFSTRSLMYKKMDEPVLAFQDDLQAVQVWPAYNNKLFKICKYAGGMHAQHLGMTNNS